MPQGPRYRIVFMGTPDFAVPSLKALIAGPDGIAAVVTQPDRPRGRGRKPTPCPVKVAAQEANLPVLQPEKARAPEFIDQIEALAPDLLVVAAYGQILPQRLLDVPRLMPMNVHGSLLPKYRGAAPIQWALIEGDRETGITIMQMDAGMDTGPMLLKGSLAIDPEESFGSLYARMAALGANLLMEALALLREGKLPVTLQPQEGVTYAPPVTSEMQEVDWTQPAHRVAGLIRALDPKPGAYSLWQGNRLRLYRPCVTTEDPGDAAPGEVLRADGGGVIVAAGSGAVCVRELQWPGKNRMAVADFLRGRPIPPGTRLGS